MTDLAIRVQPRAKRTEVAGERDGAVVIRVSAPPVDGKANEAVCKLIAERLGVAARLTRRTGFQSDTSNAGRKIPP